MPAGPYGAAGEIGPLAHLFQTLIGEGLVARGQRDRPCRARRSTRAGAAPYELQPKEGLALIDGSPFATALAVHLVDRGVQPTAAGRARRGAVDRRHRRLDASTLPAVAKPLAGSTGRTRRGGADGAARGRPVVGGPPAGARVDPRRAAGARGAARPARGAGARTRSACRRGHREPSVLRCGADEPGGLYASGAFHAAATTLLLESSRSRVAQVTNLVEKRLHRLLDSRFSGTARAARHAFPAGRRARCRFTKRSSRWRPITGCSATPASVHATDTSTGQEDVQALTFLVADRLDRALANLETALACELTALRHAAALRHEPSRRPRLRQRFRPSRSSSPTRGGSDALARGRTGARFAPGWGTRRPMNRRKR